MVKEFKEFIAKGNVMDLAVGIIIGAAFGKIVTSFVNDILMPPIGLLLGKVDFANLFIPLNGSRFESLALAKAAGAPVIAYGLFINQIIDFVIVAFAIFLVIKQVNRFKKPVAVCEAPECKECPYCFTTLPAKATRCSACTSEQPAVAE